MTKRRERNPLADRSYAKYELKTALLDGLFVSEKKVKSNDLQMRRITKQYDAHDKDGTCFPNAISVEITAPANLSVQAESVLLSILKVTGVEGQPVDADGDDFATELGGNAKTKSIGSASTSEYALLKEAGLDLSQPGHERLRRYLRQLSDVRIRYENAASGWSGVSWFLEHHRHQDGRLIILVNWRLAGAIFGDYLHALIDLDERRALGPAPAKTLHRWLSAYVWAGKTARVSYAALRPHIWPTTSNRMQLHRLRTELLPLFNSLPHWTVVIGEEHVSISHLKKPKNPVGTESVPDEKKPQ